MSLRILSIFFALSLTLSPVIANPPVFRILCLDGGGTRGVVEIEFLKALQEKTGCTPQDHFHLFAGTSVGGIIAGGLASGFDIQKLDGLFTPENAGRIFSTTYYHSAVSLLGLRSEKYLGDGIKELTKEYFGTTRLSQLQDNLFLAPVYNIGCDEPEVLASWKAKAPWDQNWEPRKKYNPQHDLPLQHATLGTAAAVPYLPAIDATFEDGSQRPYIDGGFACNNPSMVAFAHSTELLREPPFQDATICIYSLGTGCFKDPLDFNTMKDQGIEGWLGTILHITTVNKMTHMNLSKLLGADQYYRWNPDLPGKFNHPDITSKAEIDELRSMARHAVSSWDRMNDMCESLKEPKHKFW